MKYYTAIHKVYLHEFSIQKAKEFAKKVTATTNYADSNQFVDSKIFNDHFVSKIGEEAAKIVLSDFATVVGPDYNIYEEKQKSWADDLYVNNIGLAVKTQKRSTAKKYSLSWTFQSGQRRKDIILNKPDAWVVFVEYDDINFYVCYVYPPFQIKELTFGEPKLSYLKEHKKVVYADSLPVKI